MNDNKTSDSCQPIHALVYRKRWNNEQIENGCFYLIILLTHWDDLQYFDD